MDETSNQNRALVPVTATPSRPGATKGEAVAAEKRSRRVEAKIKYAIYSLADTLTVAAAIHERGGGEASVDELAAYLDYRSANNGAFFDRLSAARMFGLIQGQGAKITLTQRATDILMPVYPDQVTKAKVEAFLSVPLFGAIYEEFRGKVLPPEPGMRNLLRTKYGVPPSRIVPAYGALMRSAEQAGFFATRGTKSQLIVPRYDQVIGGAPPEHGDDDHGLGEAPELDTGQESGMSADKSRNGGAAASSMNELKSRYIATLIDMLNKKEEPDVELMSKIEKLLGMTEVDV